MPELPDVAVYVECLARRIVGTRLEALRIHNPFLVRSFDPPISVAAGRKVEVVRRLGKRIVIDLEAELHLVLHLMIAGRLRWVERGSKIPGKVGLAAFDFERGTLIFTEAGTRRRASLHLVRGADGKAAHERGGLEVLEAGLAEFAAVLARGNHTLKRALTDPTAFSGIGNAYSDEILHRARLSPLVWTSRLSSEEIERLFRATRDVLNEWTERLRAEVGDGFPGKVTAFRAGMAVHGRFKQPCPVCGSAVQRIVHAENECNYCARCQTGGKLLADRALSRLLRQDWPRTIDEWEERQR